jgi:hypothetical protein
MIKKTKKEREKIIFETFATIVPNFAGEQMLCEQFSKDPPDFMCKNNKNRIIGVELVEWLHQTQTTMSRALEDLEKAIRIKFLPNTIKDFLKNHDVSLFPVLDKFPSKLDRPKFISELNDILNKLILLPLDFEEENMLNDFSQYPTLEKFITSIYIFPTRLSFGIEFVKGGPYSPEYARDAIIERLSAKINLINYKNLKEKLGLNEFYLIIYYSMALIYNSPLIGVKQDIHSIVDYAREMLIKNHGPFDKIFLFYALEPKMAVFPLWP